MDERLNDLLSRWHEWQRHGRMVKGFAQKALVCGDFRISRQYDDENGALDEAIEHQRMRTVDFQVCEMLDPHKAAIYTEAKNIHAGFVVYISPRLPTNREERLVIIAEARNILAKRLLSAGVM